ncbi:MAG: TonB-dependent receptor, partial [Acidobacteria bacterium]|nr:TonB-dependent receptor [Acidobacteriota bacterium]
IAGVVRDTSGAVLPGVTVEASSPALIEKVRSAATDGTGQYRIENLRPGLYTVTFTLSGFSPVRREGIELTGTFTATVSAELRVGGLAETVTVSGEAPIVDVQNTTQQRVFDQEVTDALPTGRLPSSLAVLIPGMTTALGAVNYTGLGAQEIGGAGGDTTTIVAIHGGQSTDYRQNLNGLSTGWANEAFETLWIVNTSATQEVVVDATAVSAEAAEGGVRTNLIPRDGGNAFSGIIFGSFSNESMAGRNFDDDLRARGLRTPNAIKVNGDFNPGFGGPIRRDRLWFYSAMRYMKADAYVGDMFLNRTVDDLRVFRFDPDLSRPAENRAYWLDGQARLTWQATPKHKIAWSWSQQKSCKCPSLITATTAPEAGADNRHGYPLFITTGDWTAPLTNRLLVDGSILYHYFNWGFLPYRDRNQEAIGLTEQTTGITFKARPTGYQDRQNRVLRYRATLSYITGAHSFKVGFNNSTGSSDYLNFVDQPISYRLNNGIPNLITLRARPFHNLWEMDADIGLFAQDRWTVDRWTLTGGVRLDYKKTHFPGQQLQPVPLAPNWNITIPETPQLSWKDVTPKLGVAYDVFGTGRTALKVTLNKYLTGRQLDEIGNPVLDLVHTASRAWTDTNGTFTPDCNLLNPDPNGECRALSDPNFGGTRRGTNYDPELMRGWGVREYNWEFSTAVQHELLPRVSTEIGYFRRWYGNLGLGTPTGASGGVSLVTMDNRTLSAADFDTFCITAPSDPRLPGGGGGYDVCGLYDLKPNRFGLAADNFVTSSKNYGTQIQHFNGFDFSMNARLPQGILLQGGVSTGRTSTDNCEVVDKVPEILVFAPNAMIPRDHCHVDTAFLTQVKLLGSYTIPGIDVRLAGSLQSIPGPPISAYLVVPSAVAARSLGRPLAGGAANVTVNIVEPGTMYGDRLNQLDVRASKILRVGTTRTTLNLDVNNVLNVNPVTAESPVFTIWRRPQSILLPRFAKISMQFDW